MSPKKNERKGNTLVEVMLSVAVLGMLFIIVNSAVDIGDIFAKLLSTGHDVAVRTIGEGITDYRWVNEGNVPPESGITSTLKPVCKETLSQAQCSGSGGVYLGSLMPDFMAEVPISRDYLDEAEWRAGFEVQFPYGGGERLRVISTTGSGEFIH